MKRIQLLFLAATLVLAIAGCNKQAEPKLVFKFKFDPTQQRLNNVGQPADVPAGHAGQNPSFHSISAHYIELAPDALTALGGGQVLYKAPQTNAGGDTAIDFEQAIMAGDSEVFFSMPLKNVAKGDYQYLRISLAYQNYDIKLYVDTTISTFHIQQEFPCTVASFIGFNTYIKSYKINSESDTSIKVNASRLQGYWGAESSASLFGQSFHIVETGQAPKGATTVVNPIFATSPIPQGSCVVTAQFDGGKLSVTGNQTNDIVVTVSLSTNKSFEWIDAVPDGKWEPTKGESVVDMGIRGMVPYIKY